VDLFVYGTLMVSEVMHGVCGYRQPGQAVWLADHRRRLVAGEVYPAIVPWRGERVRGLLYPGVSERQVALLDAFEGELYERRPVTVNAGQAGFDAETYVLRESFIDCLSGHPWTLEAFLADGFQRFAREYPGFDRAAGRPSES